MDTCIISFNLNYIMQLKQFYDTATKVSCRKSATTFGDLPDCSSCFIRHNISRELLERKWVNHTVYPKKYAHGFCFAVLCRGYTLTDFPISTRLTSLALWQSNDCPSASKATMMNMDKYFMWIHYERLHNHNKAKHNKTVCIFIGINCTIVQCFWSSNEE